MIRKYNGLCVLLVVLSMMIGLVLPTFTALAQATSTPSEPKLGGILTMSLGTDFVTFHPYFDETNKEYKPIVFEAPVRRANDGTFQPWLAKSYEVSADGKSVTLHLRKGVKFHNGREMTADDIVWSVEYASNPDYGTHIHDFFVDCAGAEKIDDYTVQVNYNRVTHIKLDGIARLYIFPKEAASTIDKKPVGTGPFKFEEWVPGDHATFVKFADYWRKGLPYLDGIVIKSLPDPASRMLNLVSGSVDFIMDVPESDAGLLRKIKNIVVEKGPVGFNFMAFIMNINKPPFDNQLVRQAMNYAIDRKEICKLAFFDEFPPTAFPFAEFSLAYYDDLAHYYHYDPDKAKELLAQAGYPNGFEVDMVIRGTGGFHLEQAKVYQAQLARIGVKVNILPTPLPQYWPILINSKFAIVSHMTGGAVVDPSGAFAACAAMRPFRNFFGITDNTTWFPKYSEAITKAAESLNTEERKKYYHEALTIFVEQGWTIPVAWWSAIFARKDFVRGIEYGLNSELFLGETWLDK